jgi:hypothetical protein
LFCVVLLQGDELAKPGAVRALRCQLRRANPFYADSPAPASQLAPKQLQVHGATFLAAPVTAAMYRSTLLFEQLLLRVWPMTLQLVGSPVLQGLCTRDIMLRCNSAL